MPRLEPPSPSPAQENDNNTCGTGQVPHAQTWPSTNFLPIIPSSFLRAPCVRKILIRKAERPLEPRAFSKMPVPRKRQNSQIRPSSWRKGGLLSLVAVDLCRKPQTCCSPLSKHNGHLKVGNSTRASRAAAPKLCTSGRVCVVLFQKHRLTF